MLLTTGSSVKDEHGNIYILEKVLGGGGFGNVFKAHRQSDGFVVAVKTLLSSFASPDVLLAFQKELQRTSVISSDHVIKYYFTHDGTKYPEYPPYIIMEYIDGGTLSRLLQNQAATGKLFELSFITNAYMQLAEGMNAISKTLVHRDIKPDNILVHNDKLKITDFGLSKYAADSTRTLTLKGYGTLEYVAPEAWESDKNTVQMDIYSMGIVFYQIATLQYPYRLSAFPDANAYRDAHLYQRAQNPTIHNPNLPQGLVSIILRMLEKPTQKRFSNWEDIIDALGKNTIPSSTTNTALERALANRNNADLKKQEDAATRKKAEALRDQQCKLVFSQYEAVVFEPIRAFISAFNEHYAGTTGFRFEDKHRNIISDHFSVKITTPDKKWICIDTEVVLAENHHRPMRTSSSWNQICVTSQNYIPQCKGRDVVAWSYLRDETGRGFNILLLKCKDALYGDWYILRNTNSAFSREHRAEPFGFTLQELPKEIVHIDALHIYNSEFRDFDIADVENFLADRA